MVEVKGKRASERPRLGIGEVARLAGVTTSALRFYDARGLIRATERESGRRRYDEMAVKRVKLLVAAQRAGFSLGEIGTLLDTYDSTRPAPAEWRALADRKLLELEAVIERACEMQRLLRHALECQCKTLGECTLVDGEARAGSLND
jgi:MerR family redox-sensitive transcriptional activator SoxR